MDISADYRKICFIFILLPSLLCAHPGWLQPGVTAYYEGIGAFKDASGRYHSGVQMDVTERVDSVSNGNIVVTVTYVERSSGYTITNTSTYRPTDLLGAFWADEKTLQKAKNGEKIGIFTVTKGPYQDRFTGKIWNAVMLEVKDRVEVRMVFEERTGLLIHYAEVYPNQETYVDFKSINIDLSGYTTPGVPAGGSTGNGGNTPQGTPLMNSNLPCCGSVFLILAGVSLLFARKVGG